MALTGTHAGEFMGIPATEARVDMALLETFRLVEGRVAEMWLVADQWSLLRRLGVVPSS